MPEPAQQPIPAGPSWADLRQRSGLLLDRYDATMAEVTAGTCTPDLARRVSLLTAAFREHHGQLTGITWHEAYAGEIETRAFQDGRAAERAASSGRRRVPVPRHAARNLRPVFGVAFLCVVLRAGRAAGHHAGVAVTAAHTLIRHHTVAALTSAGTVAAAAGSAGVIVLSGTTVPYATPLTAPASATIQAPAIPSTGAQPIPWTPTSRLPRPQGSASGAIPSGVVLSGTPSPSPTPTATPGILTIPVMAVALGTATQGEFTITASGGPVAWTATTTAAGVALGTYAGTLGAEQSDTVTVTVDPDLAGISGSTVIDISTSGPGPDQDQQVTVTWGAPAPR